MEVFTKERNENITKKEHNNNTHNDIEKEKEKINQTKNIFICKHVKNYEEQKQDLFANHINEYYLHILEYKREIDINNPIKKDGGQVEIPIKFLNAKILYRRELDFKRILKSDETCTNK